MVGYDEHKQIQLSHSFMSGVFGGIVTRAIVTPLDVLKIRFQLQPGTLAKQLKYTGIIQATRTIWKEEGLFAFWKGHVPAQFLSMIYGGMQFGSFQHFTKIANSMYPHTRDDYTERAFIHFGCGCLSGAVATVTAHPVDVLRTRFAAQKEPKVYRSMVVAAMDMRRTEGMTCFYRGLTPALIQVMPYSGLQFAAYSLLQTLWRKASLTEGSVANFLCGAGAGIVSKCLVYPLDVTKKRLQVQGFSRGTVSEVMQYNSFRHCVITIWSREGATGFYKGLSAAILKSCSTSGLIFFTYELFSDILSKHSW
uniref:Mitochondrial thiamine pyrophosphate carrier n=1 Tax=Phallusia mammillata TaxID=59560 RepID=A0A6F9DSM1_9ASCI|nr:mitochondrial thiamine pyrophosphate carrier-like [Phallusia mammillata]